MHLQPCTLGQKTIAHESSSISWFIFWEKFALLSLDKEFPVLFGWLFNHWPAIIFSHIKKNTEENLIRTKRMKRWIGLSYPNFQSYSQSSWMRGLNQRIFSFYSFKVKNSKYVCLRSSSIPRKNRVAGVLWTTNFGNFIFIMKLGQVNVYTRLERTNLLVQDKLLFLRHFNISCGTKQELSSYFFLFKLFVVLTFSKPILGCPSQGHLASRKFFLQQTSTN
jgi:hypothetical protein